MVGSAHALIAYKFLSEGTVGLYSGFRWPVGEWVETGRPLIESVNGIHACRVRDLPNWIDDELWTAELAGETVERDTMVMATRGRLVGRIEGWTQETAQAFADDCARQARDQAAGALRRRGLDTAAAEVSKLVDLAEIQAWTAEYAARGEGYPASAAAFAADTVALARGWRPDSWLEGLTVGVNVVQRPATTAANLGFVVANGAGLDAADAGGTYAAGFAAERARQVAWLAERLGLERV